MKKIKISKEEKLNNAFFGMDNLNAKQLYKNIKKYPLNDDVEEKPDLPELDESCFNDPDLAQHQKKEDWERGIWDR